MAPDAATLRVMTREELHRKVDALSEAQLDRVRLVLLDEVDSETSVVEAILSRHGERRLSPEEFEKHFGHLPQDGEG